MSFRIHQRILWFNVSDSHAIELIDGDKEAGDEKSQNPDCIDSYCNDYGKSK